MAQADRDLPNQTLEERVRWLEEQLAALQEREASRPRAILQRLVPPEVRRHLRAAQRERLLAVRTWIDVTIKRSEEPPERPRRADSIHID